YEAWQRRLNCPLTSAAGRVFDAAAALICGVGTVSFEAQGPMLLESLCRRPGEPVALPLAKDAGGILRSDWQPLIPVMQDETRDAAWRAESFHSSMARVILEQARRIRELEGVYRIGLCGGVFQNRVLTEQAIALLENDRFDVYLSQQLPCNDAALSFGQAAEIAARQTGEIV
ncbi:MAG: carbamoyltransferase HypF, partial [Woeseiaceae bacterium]|nr:carbamoyltransferase HypF [Woeseiaceae bacterium]